ncbi:MAG: MFS transporter [Actinomycetota bacterium]
MSGAISRTFASLRVRNFRLFIGGQLLSASGTWMQGVAAPLLVLRLTRGSDVQALWVGLDTALQFLPIMILGAYGGVLADRFDNRHLQIITQILYATVAAVFWIVIATGVVELWMVLTLSFLTGAVMSIDMPTRQSFYLEMVGPEQLTNAMSLNTATFTGSRIFGSALGGLLVAAFGFAPVFAINALTYLAVVAALLAMRTAELRPRERVKRQPGQIREGIRYVWNTPALRVPMVTMAVVFLFSFNFVVLIPLLVQDTFGGGARLLGVLMSLWGVGSLAGALYLASRSTRPNPRRLAMFGVALGGTTLLLALAPTVWAAGFVMPLLGAMGIAFAITGNSTLQLTAVGSMRGRVMAIYTVVFLGSTPIGALLAGAMAAILGPRWAFAISGVIASAAGVVALSVVRRLGIDVPAGSGAERERVVEAEAAVELTQPEVATGD